MARPDTRHEPPSLEKSVGLLNPRGRKGLVFGTAELDGGSNQGIVLRITCASWFLDDDLLTFRWGRPVVDLDEVDKTDALRPRRLGAATV